MGNPAGDIDSILRTLGTSKFRSRFRLREKEKAYVREKGLGTVRHHAEAFITERLAPANPKNDGRQTPMRNHPVFIAQHATATCCRGCLEKWHKIPKGKSLTPENIDFIVDLILAWIGREMPAAGPEGEL